MKTPFTNMRTNSQDNFTYNYTNVLCVSLATLLLVSCGAKVAEERAAGEAAAVRQAAIADAERSSANAPPAPPPTRQPPPTRSTSVVSEAVFRAQQQQLMAPPDSQSTSASQELRIQSLESMSRSISDLSGASGTPEPADGDLSRYTGPLANHENYEEVDENSVHLVADKPVSTFSIDVDTAGYSNVRRMILQEGRLPPHDAVRLEEMINYFDYDYPNPTGLDQPLAIHTELAAAPWNPTNRLLMVGIQGYEPNLDARPPANLVFLVDVSGSMNAPNKLGLVQRSLKLLVDQMQDHDRIALVVYAGAAGMVLDSTAGDEKATIKQAIDSLRAGGSTNGAAGIQLAYQIAERHQIEGGINRVLIASDGDLNVGVTDIDDLKELISKKRDNGIALTTLGYGSGNYNYSLMEQIADVGNGNAAYIDSLNEARKVLVDQMQATLMTIAKDVKIQIEFNPAMVKEYRLLGYENRLLNREDFRNDAVDAGEIGAGHTVTALYELTLTDSDGGLIPDRRYGASGTPADTDLADELAYIKVRHKPADGDTSTVSSRPILVSETRAADASSGDFRFAAAVAGFAQLLRGGKHTGDFSYEQVLDLARSSRGNDTHGYRSELLNLVEMAKLL